MQKMLVEFPTPIETRRLLLRAYSAGDGPWYHVMSQKNQAHLSRYESQNAVMFIKTVQDGEIAVREMAASWAARNAFFLGAFLKSTRDFVAQIYVGPVSWHLPEFQVGYFADRDHEGMGYVTEAVQATLQVLFRQLQAHRVSIHCNDTNLRSYRLAERCGLVREGHIRENKRNVDGSTEGDLHYGLLRSEFEAQYGH